MVEINMRKLFYKEDSLKKVGYRLGMLVTLIFALLFWWIVFRDLGYV